MQVLEDKGLCSAGDIWYNNGNPLVCPDYKRIAELNRYIQRRKSKDHAYFEALKELRELINDDLQWELTN